MAVGGGMSLAHTTWKFSLAPSYALLFRYGSDTTTGGLVDLGAVHPFNISV